MRRSWEKGRKVGRNQNENGLQKEVSFRLGKGRVRQSRGKKDHGTKNEAHWGKRDLLGKMKNS